MVVGYVLIFVHKNVKGLESLGDTDMGEMIILKWILKAKGYEDVDCIDVAEYTVKL